MSEPDSAPPRQPPTIDLKAEEVGGQGSPGRAKSYAIGIAIGAAAVGALAAALWITGFAQIHDTATSQTATAPSTTPSTTPSTAPSVAPNAAPGAESAKGPDTAEISARLDKIQETLATPRSDEALANRMTTVEAQTKSLGDTIAALTRRVDDIATASQSALAQVTAATAAADAAKRAAETGVTRSDVDAMTSRIAAFESAVKALSADVAQRTSSADDRATRATVAAEALRAAVERGSGFRAELAAVKSLGGDPAVTEALEPFAADGIPSSVSLGRELTALLPAMQRAAEPPSNDGSFIGRLENHARNLVHVMPLDAPAIPAGDDRASAIARLGADAARGNLAAAIAEIAQLPDAARALADGWVKKAQAREAAVAASRRIAADALAALSKPVSQ
jgi:hypothetical protein